jgi:hypothetical protein
MMAAFRATEPDFYNAYSTARIIVYRAATRPAKKSQPETPAKPTT